MKNQTQKNIFSNPIKRAVFTTIPLLFGLVSTPLHAGSATTTLNVSATIAGNSCSFIVENLNFGNYLGAELTATANMSVDCGGENILWSMTALDGGNSADLDNRFMLGASSSNQLNYQIYKDPAHTQTYSSGSRGGTGDMASSPIFYGVITAGQALVADNYSDSIIINLAF